MMPINSTLKSECENLINNDFRNEIRSAIRSRNRWHNLNQILDVGSTLLQGSTVIMLFIAGATSIPAISIVAGCIGVATTVSMTYNQYCKTQYKNQTIIIKNMTKKINIPDILPDDNLAPPPENTLQIANQPAVEGSQEPALETTQTITALTLPEEPPQETATPVFSLLSSYNNQSLHQLKTEESVGELTPTTITPSPSPATPKLTLQQA